MARLILHIGTHKTATTAFQNFCAANRGTLAARGLIYPDLGPIAGHHGLTMQWLDLPKTFALPGGPVAAWRELAKRHADSAHTILLSSEEFSRGQPKSANFHEIRTYFAAFEEIRVICTLRDQLSYLQSIYLELSKSHVPPPWPVFLTNALNTHLGAGLFLDFAALDRHLCRAFAAEEIHYLDFTTQSRGDGGMIAALLAAAGLPHPATSAPGEAEGRANVSAPALAVWAANQIASPYPTPPALLERAIAAVQEDMKTQGRTGKSTVYTRQEELRLRAHFAPLNARFCEDLAQRQPGFQLCATAPAAGDFFREDLSPGFWLRLARQLHHAA